MLVHVRLVADSVAIDEALLALKVGFLVLLYLFIWRIVRTASRDIRVPQESFVLAPQPGQPPPSVARLVVVASPTLQRGSDFTLDGSAITIGRGAQNDVELEGDGVASAVHARVEPRPDGIWGRDEGSTNGTFVNGVKIDGPRRLSAGDVVRVGETDFRFE